MSPEDFDWDESPEDHYENRAAFAFLLVFVVGGFFAAWALLWFLKWATTT